MRRIPYDFELKEALQRVIGRDDAAFKSSPDQLSIVKSILKGKDVLTVISTGGGKSVCYQVPALCFPGLTLVISPLLSLIEDQVATLTSHGIEAACLTSNFLIDSEGKHFLARSANDDRPSARKLRNRLFKDAAEGKYKLLYVTPERLRTGPFIRFAQHANISMIAIDEAHCISLWGYEFRPLYLEISRFLTRLGYRPVIAAFTATATKSVKDDIIHFLGMNNPVIYSYPPKRDNLRFAVKHFGNKSSKSLYISKWLLAHPDESGMIYCSSTRSVDELYAYLKEKKIPVTRYYAGLNDNKDSTVPLEKGESKALNFSKFKSDKAKVMISTTALGMGIDKANVRFVIHYEIPTCIEDYYQEAGRAGRDGKYAYCLLCYDFTGKKICKSLIDKSIGESGLTGTELLTRKAIAYDRYAQMLGYCDEKGCNDSRLLQNKILNYYENYRPLSDKGVLDRLNDETEKESERLDLLEISTFFGTTDADGHNPFVAEMQNTIDARISEADVLYANRTKIAGELRKGNMEGTDLRISSAKDKNLLTVSFKVTGESLSFFDLMIADAVYTLMKNKKKTIHAKHIMELLSGNPKLTLRPERKAEIDDSLRKMMRTNIMIDRQNSLSYGFEYGSDEKKEIISGPFLPLKEFGSGFTYDRNILPPLYEYAEILNGQFYVFPMKRLSIPNYPTSAENLSILYYLLIRCDSMRRNIIPSGYRSATRRAIRFDSLIKTLRIDFPEDTYERNRKMKTLKEKEKTVLNYLKSIQYIKNFSFEDETGNVTEIEYLTGLPKDE